MDVIAEGILRGCQGLFTPMSLGYPLSVFNKKLYSQTLKSKDTQFAAVKLPKCLEGPHNTYGKLPKRNDSSSRKF